MIDPIWLDLVAGRCELNEVNLMNIFRHIPSVSVMTLCGLLVAVEPAQADDVSGPFLVGDGHLSTDIAGMIHIDQSSEIGPFTVNSQIAQSEEDENDPLEGLNRAIFAFNDVAYSYVLGPIADAYGVLPQEARTVVDSVLSNLRGPVMFFNDLLQGEFERAGTTLIRFGMNSTVGFGGMADVASSFGYEEHSEDFGQTLAVWGAGEGFYLVLPLLGPSNPRDAIGQYLVDPMMDPFSLYVDNTDQDEWTYARTGVTAVHEFSKVRTELDELKRTSVDYYAAVRSLYRQRRAAEIANGELTNIPAIPDFDLGIDDFDPDSAPSVAQTDEQASLPTPGVSAGTSVIEASNESDLWEDPLSIRFEPLHDGVVSAGKPGTAIFATAGR